MFRGVLGWGTGFKLILDGFDGLPRHFVEVVLAGEQGIADTEDNLADVLRERLEQAQLRRGEVVKAVEKQHINGVEHGRRALAAPQFRFPVQPGHVVDAALAQCVLVGFIGGCDQAVQRRGARAFQHPLAKRGGLDGRLLQPGDGAQQVAGQAGAGQAQVEVFAGGHAGEQPGEQQFALEIAEPPHQGAVCAHQGFHEGVEFTDGPSPGAGQAVFAQHGLEAFCGAGVGGHEQDGPAPVPHEEAVDLRASSRAIRAVEE